MNDSSHVWTTAENIVSIFDDDFGDYVVFGELDFWGGRHDKLNGDVGLGPGLPQ